MRILIVSQYFWPEQFRINDLAQELKLRGHQVSVLTGMPNYPSGRMPEGYSWWQKRRDSFEGIPLFRVPLFLRRQGRGWQLALNYLSFVLFACLLGPWLLRKEKVDAIFVFEPSPFTVGIPAVLLRRIKKAPLLFWVQDLWPESVQSAGMVNSPLILKGIGRMVRWIYSRCDRVLLQSEGFTQPAVEAGAALNRITYFPNWAESFYRPLPIDENAPECRQMPDGFRIVFAGNLGEAQSLGTVLDAALLLKHEKDIHWVMIGDGRRKPWLESEVRRHGIATQFHFLGQKPAEKMPAYFACADALLVTLKDEPTFNLTIPSKVQSYLACGRPIIGALNGEGAKVIEQSGAGIAVVSESAEKLADAVLKIYRSSQEERDLMGKQGAGHYARHFERGCLIDRLEEILADTVRGGECES